MLLCGLVLQLLLCSWLSFWRSSGLLKLVGGRPRLGRRLHRRLLCVVWVRVRGLSGGRGLTLWSCGLAELLLPFAELLLEPAVVFVDVAPEDRRQGVHPSEHLARLVVRVVWEAERR